MKFKRTNGGSGSRDGHGARFNQHDGRSPERQVIAKGTDLELVVIAADLSGGERLEGIANHGAQFSSSACVQRCHCAARRTRPRAARSTPAWAALPTDVRQLWLWRLKPTRGFEPVAQRLENLPSGVCRRSASRLMSMLCAFRRLKRSAPSGFSIGTKCSVSRERIRETAASARCRGQILEDIEQRRRRGRLVAVHLRPEEDVHGARNPRVGN